MLQLNYCLWHVARCNKSLHNFQANANENQFNFIYNKTKGRPAGKEQSLGWDGPFSPPPPSHHRLPLCYLEWRRPSLASSSITHRALYLIAGETGSMGQGARGTGAHLICLLCRPLSAATAGGEGTTKQFAYSAQTLHKLQQEQPQLWQFLQFD